MKQFFNSNQQLQDDIKFEKLNLSNGHVQDKEKHTKKITELL